MYNPEEVAVYIHWPYCKSKCPYCDFYKELARNVNQDDIIEEYLSALRQYQKLLPNRTIKSIFFGGGTPSLIKPQNIARLIDEICKLWPLKPQAEISLEANPNSHYKNMFADLKTAGINRLSLGVQALNDADLRFLGRTHNADTARRCLDEVCNVFANHSADLIYARPQQKLLSWQQELEEITSYGLHHISLYQLTIEENTVFARKGIKPLNEDDAAEMYDYTRDFLAACGYNQYEVSNFARQGYESSHNLTYWQGGDYIGIGKSAHGRLHYEGKMWAVVYPFINEELTAAERAEELIIMGLRLNRGIDKRDFKQICGLDFAKAVNTAKLQQLIADGYLQQTPTHIKATYKGFPVLNRLIAELCL